MDFDSFYREIAEKNIEFTPGSNPSDQAGLLSNEALFHLPLLAAIVLMLAKGRVKPGMAQIGQIVGECMESAFISFKGSSQHIGWSGNLRMRTVRALTFLEASKFVLIDSRKKVISTTDLGNKVLNRVLGDCTDLSCILKDIERSYKNICNEKQIALELI